MIGFSRLIADTVRINLEDVDGPIESWIATVFGPLDGGAGKTAKTDITIRFVDHVPTGKGRLWPLPVGQVEDGLSFTDHLGYSAAMRFPLSENEILVDRKIDPWFFQRWIYMPLIKASLWKHGISLMHSAALKIDGRRVAITGWAGAGKTPIMLSLLERGAELIGDDWVALTEDGTVFPLSAQLNLTDSHEPFVAPSRWPGTKGSCVPIVKKAAERSSKLFGRFRKLSLGLARVADAAAAAGKMKLCLTDVYPEAKIAAGGPLDAVFVLARAGMDAPPMEMLPEVLAASSRSELLYCDDFESVIRFSLPGLLKEPLFGSVNQETSLFARATFGVHREAAGHDRSVPKVSALTDHILDVLASLPAKTEAA